jgi:thymidylate kinase
MEDTKLLVVTGISGVGKSTTAQNLARLYKQNDICYYWYHEEMKDHPIRWINGGEFKEGSLFSEEGMQLNIADMYERWTSLINKITDLGGVHIMEGCLYENINRYFFKSNYPKNKIISYYDDLMKILEPANLKIIYLYRPDVKANLEKAFKVRGDKWKNIILNPKGTTYFDTLEYVGEDSIFSMWEDYQNFAHTIFERFEGSKIKIDTSNEQWASYLKRLAEKLDIKYFDKEDLPLPSPDKYCGRFFCEDVNGKLEVDVICEEGNLYCSPFWFKDKRKSINVTGNYDWGIVGKTLQEFKE